MKELPALPLPQLLATWRFLQSWRWGEELSPGLRCEVGSRPVPVKPSDGQSLTLPALNSACGLSSC